MNEWMLRRVVFICFSVQPPGAGREDVVRIMPGALEGPALPLSSSACWLLPSGSEVGIHIHLHSSVHIFARLSLGGGKSVLFFFRNVVDRRHFELSTVTYTNIIDCQLVLTRMLSDSFGLIV